MIRFDIPDPGSLNATADWVEFYITLTKGELSKHQLHSHIESSYGLEVPDYEIDNIWQKLGLREILYGNKPPFFIDKYNVISNIDWMENPEYMVCLIFSLAGNPTDTIKSGRLFENNYMVFFSFAVN